MVRVLSGGGGGHQTGHGILESYTAIKAFCRSPQGTMKDFNYKPDHS
jgi:hypothetical protein